MIDIELSRVEESGEQIVVRRNTFEDEKEAEEIYNLLTDGKGLSDLTSCLNPQRK